MAFVYVRPADRNETLCPTCLHFWAHHAAMANLSWPLGWVAGLGSCPRCHRTKPKEGW